MCANHIIWGFERITGVQRSYEGATIQEAWTDVLASVQQALDADTGADRALVQRAATTELAATRDDVIQAATTRFELPRKLAADAYDMAEVFEEILGPCGATCRGSDASARHAVAGQPLRARSRREPPPYHGQRWSHSSATG